MTRVEMRGLDYFRWVVAPALANTVVDRSFWTGSALQVATLDEPARYAVLAISALYEHFEAEGSESGSEYSATSAVNSRALAISNYNRALRRLSSTQSLDPSVALVTSVLFICIEFLRGVSQVSVAIDHCRHGIQIFNKHGGTPEVLALFRHLSIFPYFFGANLSNFPILHDDVELEAISNLSQAAEAMDCLMSLSVRLVRSFDPWRLGLSPSEPPLHMWQTQDKLLHDLRRCLQAMQNLKSTQGLDEAEKSAYRMLEIRWLVCHIWINTASSQDETYFDRFLKEFQRIVVLAREEQVYQRQGKNHHSRRFTFEMGLGPLLHFVVIKCRSLQTRLEGLSLVQSLTPYRESTWDSRCLYAIGRRMVEFEHGIEVTPDLLTDLPKTGKQEGSMPGNVDRIRDMYLEGEEVHCTDLNGTRESKWTICFLMLDPTQPRHECKIVRDWITLPPKVSPQV